MIIDILIAHSLGSKKCEVKSWISRGVKGALQAKAFCGKGMVVTFWYMYKYCMYQMSPQSHQFLGPAFLGVSVCALGK